MKDPRFDALARQLVGYSTRLQQGDHILLELSDAPDEMAVALIRAVRAAGGFPHIRLHHGLVSREMMAGAQEEQYAAVADDLMHEMKRMQAYIAIRGANNSFENSSVPPDKMQLVMKHMRPVVNQRVTHTRWCGLRWPTPSMAQQAGMGTETFEDFYFRCCLMDYAPLKAAMDILAKRMEATDQVHITGPGTDLRFSIKGMPAIPCAGEYNMPDGEVFTAPIRDSVEGILRYNAPTVFQGTPFDGIEFRFEKGRIVEAHCNGNDEGLRHILDTDEGARYIGEFALGVNPAILQPMRDILFDEKIAGSFHFTPGEAYEVAPNGNHSQVHWDLVCIQRKDYGGGEIRFDGELIRKDGLFLDPALACLNPEPQA